MVGTAGRHDHILAGRHGFFVANFWIGVGQGEHDGVVGHALNHRSIHKSAFAQPQEHVGPFHRVGQTVVGLLRRVALLAFAQPFAARVDVAAAVEDRHVLALHAELLVDVQAGHGGRTRPADHHADVFDVFAGELQRIDQRRRTDDGRTVLVVVHQRDVQLFLQAALDLERFRRLDVLQIDAAEGGRNGLHRGDKLVDVGGVHFDVEHVDVGEHLEQHPLPFHHRLARLRPDVAQPQHRGAVADDRDQVALGGVLVHVLRLLGNGHARLCHAWAVRQAEVTLRAVRLGGDHLHLASTFAGMVFERLSFQVVLLHEETKFTTNEHRTGGCPSKGCTTARANCGELALSESRGAAWPTRGLRRPH